MIVGIDCDGILADFNASFVRRIIFVTGRNLFPTWPFEISTWNYPETFGYTSKETHAVWASIKKDPLFWAHLEVLPEAFHLCETLRDNPTVYFITSRPGPTAKAQTEFWLKTYMKRDNPTVLISSEKGYAAQALDLDIYIDDKVENCEDVRDSSPRTSVFMLAQPWNRPIWGVPRLDSLAQFAEEVR